MHLCLISSLKTPSIGIRDVESWLDRVWGKMPVSIKTMDLYMVLIQLSLSKEIDEILNVAEDSSSPFVMLDRWMEVISVPPHPQWVKIFKVPLQAWRGSFSIVRRLFGGRLRGQS